MREDAEGFLMPFADASACVNCGICERTCPAAEAHPRDGSPTCFAAKSTDAELVRASSSGGLFSEFALKVLAAQGVVYGAAVVGPNLDVRHIRVDCADGLAALRGSKYAHSETGTVFRSVREDLKTHPVLFTGTPCQIAGLRAFLAKEDPNLLTVEVICHGTPPDRLYRDLKREMAERHGRLTAISFRDKAEGWTSRAITGWYATGRKIRERGELNDYFRAFIAHLTLRRSCEDCRFNDGRSGADITLGDFWGVETVLPELADDTGVSAVILHTERGRAAFAGLDCHKYRVALADIAMSNPSYQAPRVADPHRDAFLAMTTRVGIHAACRKYCPLMRQTLLRRVIGKLKRMLMR